MRPSLAAHREPEMLKALEACIAEHGIAGLTVQMVAEKSGYSRGHVRHYLGNKSDQLRALVDVYVERYATDLERLVDAASPADQRTVVLDELFGEPWLDSRPEDDAVLDNLTAYAASNPDSGVSIAPMYERIVAVIERTLAPVLDADEAGRRARTLVALAYGASSMVRMGVIRPSDVQSYARSLLEIA